MGGLAGSGQAIGIGDAVWRIGADLSGLRRQLGEAQKAVGQTMQNVGRQTRRVGMAFTAVGGAITGTLGMAVNETMKFRSALAEAASLGGASLEVIEEAALAASRASGEDLVASVNAAYQAISAGVPEDNLVDYMRKSAEAAVAGVTDVTTAVEFAATAADAFGVDTASAFDAAFTAVQLGRTTFEELNASIGRAAPVFAGAGLELDELLSGVVALSRQGLSTAEAMTGLRGAINAIIRPSKSAWEAADALNKAAGRTVIEFGGAALASEGLTGWLRQMQEASGGNVDVMTQLIGSQEAMAAIQGLLNDEGVRYNETLDAMADKTGAMNAAYQTIIDEDPTIAWKQLRVELSILSKTIGDALLPVLGQVVERLKGVVDRISEWIDANPELTATIVKITAAVGALLLGLGPLLVVFGTLISALGGIVSAGLAAGTVGLIPLIAVFAAVGVAATALYFLIRDNWDSIKAYTIHAWSSIRRWLDENWDALRELAGATSRAVAAAFSAMWQAMSLVSELIGVVLLGRTRSLREENRTLGDEVSDASEAILAMADSLTSAAKRMEEWATGIRMFRAIMAAAWDDLTERTATLWVWLTRITNILAWLGKWQPGAWLPRLFGAAVKQDISQLMGFARGGRVGQPANIIAGEEGPELADLPGGRRVLLGSYGPGMYQVPVGTYIHKFADTMRMLASGVPFAGMYASGGTVQTVGYLEKIRDILSRLRVLGMARLPQQDQNDFWRASQEAWLRARQAINPVVHQDTFGFGARDGKSFAGALQGSGGWLRASQRQGTGGVLTEMFRFARGGRVTGSMATPTGVVINVNMAEMVVREEADIDRISERIAARVNRIVRQL